MSERGSFVFMESLTMVVCIRARIVRLCVIQNRWSKRPVQWNCRTTFSSIISMKCSLNTRKRQRE